MEIRHKNNPFLGEMWIPIGTKSVTISKIGVDDNILVNQHTGEVNATHVIVRKKVDKQKFVKTFADYMAFTFDLTAAGNKALRIVMWTLQEFGQNKDLISLDKWTHEEFCNLHENLSLSLPTFRRGLNELTNSKILAKSTRQGYYFINPNCLFNGDRIVFSTIIENENRPKLRDPNTIDMLTGKADSE